MKSRKSSVMGAVCIMLVIVLAVGALGWISKGFRDWDAKNWFKRDEQTTPTSSPSAVDENGTAMNPGEDYPLPRQMIFLGTTAATPAANEGITLTATITPADATNKAVNWSVAFKTPTSSWATGKTVTQYVTVTPTAAGSLTATVNCLKAFGEQIKITVTSQENAAMKAECLVDYTQKLQSTRVTMTKAFEQDRLTSLPPEQEGNDAFLAFNLNQGSNLSKKILSFDYVTSDYTIADTYTTTAKMYLIDAFRTRIIDAGYTAVGGAKPGIDITNGFTPDRELMSTFFWPDVVDYAETRNALRDLVWGMDFEVGHIYIEVNTVGKYSTVKNTYKVIIDCDLWDILVTGVSLNQSTIVF